MWNDLTLTVEPELPAQKIDFEADLSLLKDIDYDELEIYEVTPDEIHSVAAGDTVKTEDGKIKSSFDVQPLSLLVLAALKKSGEPSAEPMELDVDNDAAPQANAVYPCYFYARASSRHDDVDGAWIGMGMGSVSGAGLPDPTSVAGSSNGSGQSYLSSATNIVYPNQQSQRPSPDNRFNSAFYNGYPMVFSGQGSARKSFRFNEIGTSKPAVGGQYNLHWDKLIIATSGYIKMGNNYFWPLGASSTNAYRMNGTAYLNDSFNSVTFQLKNPGDASYTNQGTTQCGAGTPISQLNLPSGLTLPATKTVNGIVYHFSGWYTDAALTKPATTITGNMTVYAAYRRDFTVTYHTREYQTNRWLTPITMTVPEGTPMADLEFPASISGVDVPKMKILSWWYQEDTFTTREPFTGTVQSDITLYARYMPSVPLTVTKKTNPTNLPGPFKIHLNGDPNAFAPLWRDQGTPASRFSRIGLNEVVLSLEDGQSAMVWVPQSRSENKTGPVLKIKVTEENPNGYAQYYNWGNFVDEISRLGTYDPLEVQSSGTLTIYNSPIHPPAQTAYFYGRVNGAGDLYGLGVGGISGPLIYPADQALKNINFAGTNIGTNMTQLVTSFTDPTSYPNLTINGKTYSYGAISSSGSSDGFYTLTGNPQVSLETSVSPGVNNKFTASNTPNYRTIANITLHNYSTFTLRSENVDGTGDADPDYEVNYTITFSGNTDPVMPRSSSGSPSGGATFSVTLKSGQEASFSVPVGTKVQITDSVDSSLYKPSWSSSSGEYGKGGSTTEISINGPTTVTFTNTRDLIVPTDFESKSPLPYLLLISLLTGLFLLMTRRKKT